MILVWLAACTPDATPDDPTTGLPGTTAETGVPSPADPTGHTGSAPAWDCDALPAAPFAEATIDTVPPSEDFAFDPLGNLISHQGSFLWKSTYPPGDTTPWSPTDGGAGGPASMRMLSTGDLVYHNVDTGSLYRVAPDGTQTVVFSGFGYAGGIEIGDQDRVYVVDLLGVHVIDPYALDHVLVLASAPWTAANGITRSLDGQTMYVSDLTGIWSFPLGPDGRPAGPVTRFADAPAGVSALLGMGVDACGNVYVVGSGRVLRFGPSGGAAEQLWAEPTAYLTNLQWGSGVGGWSATHLFVVDQRGAYHELDVGVGEKPR